MPIRGPLTSICYEMATLAEASGGFRREVQPRRRIGSSTESRVSHSEPRLLLGFQGTKTARREGKSSPFSDAGCCTSRQNSGVLGIPSALVRLWPYRAGRTARHWACRRKKRRRAHERPRSLAGRGGAFGSGCGSGVSFSAASNFASAARAADRGRGARKPVVFDGAQDRGRYRYALVVGKINRRHGLAVLSLLSSKTFDPALHGGLIAVRHVHHPDHY